MIKLTDIFHKLLSKWNTIRLQPIRVLCFHQVSEKFDPISMWECDWMSTDDAKQRICKLQREGYEFISMQEAHTYLRNDIIRIRKYAVLTADDGSKTLENIIPWLCAHHIPLTLFINGSYLDGETFRETPNERYLTKKDVFELTGPEIEIGNHSWDHRDLSRLTKMDFEQSIKLNVALLSSHPRYIPFWAYPYGTHSKLSDDILLRNRLVPVLVNGRQNYNNPNVINRELLEKV